MAHFDKTVKTNGGTNDNPEALRKKERGREGVNRDKFSPAIFAISQARAYSLTGSG